MDWTSFDVVKKIRYQTRIRKVGHAGTLDPFATGVLIVMTGDYTKRSSEFMDLPKTYEADIKLGSKTDTGDRTGTIIESLPVGQYSRNQLEEVLGQFVGDIQQIPPMFSAKKVKGKKLYKLARKGEEIDREPVTVHIYGIDLLDVDADMLRIRVRCGRGTYIRVLAEDIGEKLGSLAHVKELQRTAVGDYLLQDALTIEEFIENWKSYAA